MKRILIGMIAVLLLASMCGCSKGASTGSDVSGKEESVGSASRIGYNEAVGLELDKMIGASYTDVEAACEENGLHLTKQDPAGAYTIEETVAGHPVSVNVQFWNTEDIDNLDWEEETPPEKQMCTYYYCMWDWEGQECTDEDYAAMKKVYEYYEAQYGTPVSPENFTWNDEKEIGSVTVSWKLKENELSNELSICFHVDKTSSYIQISETDPEVMEQTDIS